MAYVCEALSPQWFEERKKCLTGSKIATLMGLNKYEILAGKSPEESREALLREYRSDIPVSRFGKNAIRKMRWGQEMEVPNMILLQKLLGSCMILPVNRFYRKGLIGATIDGIMGVLPSQLGFVGDKTLSSLSAAKVAKSLAHLEPIGLVEMKQTESSYYSRDLGRLRSSVDDWKEVPPMYWAQVQVQLYVTGMPWAVLGARIGAADMRAYLIEPDREFWDKMVDAVESFFAELSR